jgi:hypothetical protein
MELTERMEHHYRPIWNPPALSRTWKPPVSDDDLWEMPKSSFKDGAEIGKEFVENMTDPKNIGLNPHRKNNLSALGSDGIGYLMMRSGGVRKLESASQIFRACVKHGRVPRTWKRSRTVFIYKKGLETLPEKWRPITITSCVYRIFTSMISELIQQHIHKAGRRKTFSMAQNGFVAGIQGCMEHAVLTREMIAHARRNRKNLHMVQIDFSDAFGSVPQEMIACNMIRMGLPVDIVNPAMDAYNGCETVMVTPGGESQPIGWAGGTVQGCPLSPALFNICLERFLGQWTAKSTKLAVSRS